MKKTRILPALWPALGLLLLLALGAAYWTLFRPTPLPIRLVEACAAGVSYATAGDETRSILAATTPWRCEISLVPDPKSEIALALVSPEEGAAAGLRITFTPVAGEARVLYEGRAGGGRKEAGWRDVTVALASLPRIRGRLVLESDPEARPHSPLEFAEPVIYRPRERPERNLILILLDTLRADRMGYAGYPRPTTPRLDALAAEGAVFENAYAPSSWTRPSTATLLTGLEPRDHRVHTRRDRLPAHLVTLAERLRNAGYATSAFSSNPNVLPYWGFDQGFERFVDVESANWARNDDVSHMIDLALEELERIRRRPFFLYLHVNQMHAPYLPPESALAAMGLRPRTPSDHYDGEIRFTDNELGRLWERVESLGLAERTLLVVAGDHGEEFGEHGGTAHGRTLYEEVLRVPVLMRYPAAVKAGIRAKRMIGLSAISPAILDLLGIAGQGTVAELLLEEREGETETEDLPLASRLELDRRLMVGLRLGRWKYIHTVTPEGKRELYDLSSDPRELRNRVSDEPAVRDRLARVLDRRLAAGRPGVHVRLSAGPLEWRKLRVTLRTTGRITGVLREGFEEEDAADLSEDGRLLTIEALVVGRQVEVEVLGRRIPRRYPDVDEVTLRLDPPGSDVQVEIEFRDGNPVAPFMRPWLGEGKAPENIRFAGETPSLSVPAVRVESARAGRPPVWIYVVPEGSAVKGEIREDIDARLRALGYVE